ncbi:MAG: NADH-quinone oxidoreductase subunit H [Armatimonadota bacterium]|nr:NADH-quinone oxidoreductase subunit H [Armatimonadota bacterium]
MSAAIPIIVNGIIVLLLAPLYDGVVRKIKAIVHSRQGPPITQVYIDILKLLGKEDLRCTRNLLFRYGPAVAFGAFLVVALQTPMGTQPSTGLRGDMITWMYFQVLGAALITLTAVSTGNPFSEVGSAREMMLMLSVEPIAVAALIAAAVKSSSLRLVDMVNYNLESGPTVSLLCGGLALFLALQQILGRVPFDIAEAETEIIGGPLVEQSGPNLALLKMAMLARQMTYGFLLIQVFVPWPKVGPWPLAVVVALIKVLILFILSGIIESVMPRLRIDQALKYMGRILFVALAALAFAAIGV